MRILEDPSQLKSFATNRLHCVKTFLSVPISVGIYFRKMRLPKRSQHIRGDRKTRNCLKIFPFYRHNFQNGN